jgi:DNA modification methylase
MQIEKINIEKLKAAKYNPRKDLKPGDAEFEKLKRSIENFGYVEPVIWNKRTGNVVGGHQRLKVLKHLGETEIDCVILDIDLNKEKALNVALNKISGAWDMPLLSDLIKELQSEDFDVTLTGFDMGEVSDLFKNGIEENVKDDDFDLDKTVQNIKTPISRQRDIWLLGKHRLMCGDSTNAEMVKELMNGTQADLLLTDPPYNVSYEGTAGTIKNDNMEDDKFRQFLCDAFKNAKEVIKCGASFYIWHADSEGYNFRGACHDTGLQVRQCLIWKKSSLVMGRQCYQWRHEPCLFGWKDGGAHYWGSDRKQTTVLEFDKPRKSELHPTMKPLELFAYQILNSTKINDIVLDLFAGSGTAIISSEQTNRICYSMEYDEKYADVITLRWIKSYGEKEVFLIRNGEKIPYNNLKI